MQSAAEELRQAGLTPAKYQLMLQVRAHPNEQQQELGARLGVTKGNVSMLVSQLERDGLLWRTPLGAANRLSLTPEGETVLDVLVPAQRRWTRRQFSALESDDMEQLIGLLRLLPQ
jgi:DNA-binding MarR family transcriptional regulator